MAGGSLHRRGQRGAHGHNRTDKVQGAGALRGYRHQLYQAAGRRLSAYRFPGFYQRVERRPIPHQRHVGMELED